MQVHEGSSDIFSSVLPTLNHFPDRCQHIHNSFGKKSFPTVPAKGMCPMFRQQDLCFHIPCWRQLYQGWVSDPRTPVDRLPTQGGDQLAHETVSQDFEQRQREPDY